MTKNQAFRWLTAILLALICLGFFAYLNRTTIYNTMNSLNLIPAPDRFTELYFQNPSKLPAETVAGAPVSFAFSINNIEGTTTVYTYKVYFENAGGADTPIKDGTVLIAANESTTIPVNYTFKASNMQGKVVVDLPSLKDQQIDFILPDTND